MIQTRWTSFIKLFENESFLCNGTYTKKFLRDLFVRTLYINEYFVLVFVIVNCQSTHKLIQAYEMLKRTQLYGLCPCEDSATTWHTGNVKEPHLMQVTVRGASPTIWGVQGPLNMWTEGVGDCTTKPMING